jgi:hypothetical protein
MIDPTEKRILDQAMEKLKKHLDYSKPEKKKEINPVETRDMETEK